MNKQIDATIAGGGAGSLLFVTDPAVINCHLAVDQSRLKIPLMFGLDVIHGLQTIFPARSAWPLPGTRSTSGRRRA
jgi:beta-glucosidase